ncbi:MAG: hypothetical protein ACRELF_19870, partial [Gemmataceae bacterium]
VDLRSENLVTVYIIPYQPCTFLEMCASRWGEGSGVVFITVSVNESGLALRCNQANRVTDAVATT